jgi:hypothetical protein
MLTVIIEIGLHLLLDRHGDVSGCLDQVVLVLLSGMFSQDVPGYTIPLKTGGTMCSNIHLPFQLLPSPPPTPTPSPFPFPDPQMDPLPI